MTEKNEKVATIFRSKRQLIAIIIAGIVAIAGIGLWVFQLTSGMVNTNMRNLDSWGIYIIQFMLFVGLSAGGLIISSAPKVFGISGFGGISKVAIWCSICCTVLAMGFIIVDLGGPARIWHLIAFSNLTSPLMWDVIVLFTYLIISIVYLWATIRVEKGSSSSATLRVLSVIALVAAISVHTVTAWVFGLLHAHEFWHTALLGPWFVSSALVSGLALVLIVTVSLNRAGYLKLESENLIKMAKLLGIFTAIDLYFFACDLLTSGFPGGSGADVVALLTTGALAPFFWAEFTAGIVTMAIAFTPKFRKPSLIVVASVLSILAILCKRIQLLIGGFQMPNIAYPAVETGPNLTDIGAGLASVAPGLIYSPSPLELGVVLGVLSLGIFIFLLGIRLLPLKP